MQEPAPKGIIQPTDQHEADLNEAVQGHLGELGHNQPTQPETQKHIPLTEDLKRIGTDVTHIAGSTFDELMGGEGGSTRDRVTSGRNPISLALKRRFLKKAA